MPSFLFSKCLKLLRVQVGMKINTSRERDDKGPFFFDIWKGCKLPNRAEIFRPEKEECSLQGKGWRSNNLLCGDHKLPPPAIWKRQGPLALCGGGGLILRTYKQGLWCVCKYMPASAMPLRDIPFMINYLFWFPFQNRFAPPFTLLCLF